MCGCTATPIRGSPAQSPMERDPRAHLEVHMFPELKIVRRQLQRSFRASRSSGHRKACPKRGGRGERGSPSECCRTASSTTSHTAPRAARRPEDLSQGQWISAAGNAPRSVAQLTSTGSAFFESPTPRLRLGSWFPQFRSSRAIRAIAIGNRLQRRDIRHRHFP